MVPNDLVGGRLLVEYYSFINRIRVATSGDHSYATTSHFGFLELAHVQRQRLDRQRKPATIH